MNERIRELAEQAGFTTDEANVTIGNYKDGNEYFYAEDFIEDELKKFAQLIVRECADVLKKDMELAHIQLIPLDFNMYANGRLQRTIKEHFGVEE